MGGVRERERERERETHARYVRTCARCEWGRVYMQATTTIMQAASGNWKKIV
jgi:hypothetical protein